MKLNLKYNDIKPTFFGPCLEVLGVLGPSLEVLGPSAKAAAMISRSRLLRSEYDVDFEGTPGVAFPLS